MLQVDVDLARRTITVRTNGTPTAEEIKAMVPEAKRITNLFHGEHIVLADMRGMTVLAPEAAELFGEVIRYGRMHGAVLCVHLSDSSITRLQAARLAREVSPDDAVTINVVSLEEAHRLIDERFPKLRPPAP